MSARQNTALLHNIIQYSLQFLFKSTHHTLRYGRKCQWVFFSEHSVQCESKNPPRDLTFFSFFHKRLRIGNRFFTHVLNVPIVARLQIFIQLSPILTKLWHIKRDYPVHIICAKCPKRAKTRAFRRW